VGAESPGESWLCQIGKGSHLLAGGEDIDQSYEKEECTHQGWEPDHLQHRGHATTIQIALLLADSMPPNGTLPAEFKTRAGVPASTAYEQARTSTPALLNEWY